MTVGRGAPDEDPVEDGKVEDVALVPQCGQHHHGEERPGLAQPVDNITAWSVWAGIVLSD